MTACQFFFQNINQMDCKNKMLEKKLKNRATLKVKCLFYRKYLIIV